MPKGNQEAQNLLVQSCVIKRSKVTKGKEFHCFRTLINGFSNLRAPSAGAKVPDFVEGEVKSHLVSQNMDSGSRSRQFFLLLSDKCLSFHHRWQVVVKAGRADIPQGTSLPNSLPPSGKYPGWKGRAAPPPEGGGERNRAKHQEREGASMSWVLRSVEMPTALY